MESSRAYCMSHILLRDTVYFKWQEFIENFKAGPDEMKTYLANMWNGIGASCFKEGTKIVDLDKEVSKEEFNVMVDNIGEILTIFVIFPKIENKMAQAQVVAIALCDEMPRYITLESWTEQEATRMREIFKDEYVPSYTVGEWKLTDEGFRHMNHGNVNNEKEFFNYISSNILKANKDKE